LEIYYNDIIQKKMIIVHVRIQISNSNVND